MNQNKHVHGSKKNSRISQDFRSYISQRSQKKESKGTNLRLLFRARGKKREKIEKEENRIRNRMQIRCGRLLQQFFFFIAARNTQHVRRRPPEENQGLHRAGHYFVLETKTNQAREGKTKFSLSLYLFLSLLSF